MHHEVICQLISRSPYSSSKYIGVREEWEKDDAFEKRAWRDRCHVNEKGNIFIPPMAFANSIKQAAKYASLKIKGKGHATYTKHFESGIMVIEGVELPIKKEDVEGEHFFVPSDGVPGSGKRVMKQFPVIHNWQGEVKYYIFDPVIEEEIFLKVLQVSGNLIGIGRFRPCNRGYYGRFECTDHQWVKVE